MAINASTVLVFVKTPLTLLSPNSKTLKSDCSNMKTIPQDFWIWSKPHATKIFKHFETRKLPQNFWIAQDPSIPLPVMKQFCCGDAF